MNARAQIELATAPGTLTGVIMPLSSDVFGRGAGLHDGVAQFSLGAPFNISAVLPAASNPFGAAFAVGDFTGPTVSFALPLAQTEICCNSMA